MEEQKLDRSLRARIYTVELVSFAVLFSLCCFAILPLYFSISADVMYSDGAIPEILGYLNSVLELAAIAVGYAAIAYGAYRFGLGSFKGGIGIFAAATGAKYLLNTFMTWITVEGSLPRSWGWDIADSVFYFALECLQLFVFVLLVYRFIELPRLEREAHSRRMERLASRSRRSKNAEPPARTSGSETGDGGEVVFDRLYDKRNVLQKCSLAGALTVLVSKTAGQLFSDLWFILADGLPEKWITVLRMLTSYVSHVVFAVICYAVMLGALLVFGKHKSGSAE